MGVMSRVAAAGRSMLGVDWNNTVDNNGVGGPIDAVDQPKKRRVPRGRTNSLDDEIRDRKREQITKTARNVQRNFEVAAFMIRKHLDFVSRFSFQIRTENESFNQDVKKFVEWWSRPRNFSVNGRHSLAKSIRLAESSRCCDGDVFFVKRKDGRVQAIEADRVRTPDSHSRDVPKFNELLTYNGIETNRVGRARRYALHSRKREGGVEFAKWVSASNIFAHGFYDRFDQERGVSPVLSSLARMQDVYENFDYALARSKVAQLFGLVFFRDAVENGMGEVSGEDSDDDGKDDLFNVKLGNRPLIFDLDPGDDAKFLENKTPAVEFQSFTAQMIAVALKSLDIPYSFFDESVGNFFGNKAALTLYEKSAQEKVIDCKELLRKLTIWRFRLAIEDGDISLPRSIKSMDDIAFEWVPSGLPWFDPRDIRGDADAIDSGMIDREAICRKRLGRSWADDVFPNLVREQEMIDGAGLRLHTKATPIQVVEVEEIENNKLETESK